MEWGAAFGRFAGLTSRRQRVVCFALGALTATGHSPLSLWPISLVALSFLIGLSRLPRTNRESGWFGWFAGTGYFAATLFWIVEPFLVDIGRHGWMAPFALLFMAGGLALFWAVGFWLAARLGRGQSSQTVALIVTLGLAELARSYVLTGFPWGLLAYVWVETPVIQLVAYIGPHGLGALTVLICALPWLVQNRIAGGALPLALIAALWGVGLYRLSVPETPPDTPVNLRLIQPNAPQAQKWDPDYSQMFFQRQLDLSALDSDPAPDLVIWPEAAVTFWLENEPLWQKQMASVVSPDTNVIFGARRFDETGFYNSLAVLDHSGAPIAVYDKHHLVPFGEYFPFGGLLSRFGIHGLASEEGGGYTAGKGADLLDLGPHGNVLPLICYEAIFPHLARRSGPRPDWILQLTNDAWYGRIAGPQQHLAQARVRAIEQGLPLVRIANTGISAVIDAKGRLSAHLPLETTGKLDAKLPGTLAQTFYGNTGDWLAFALLVLGLAFILIRLRSI